MSHSDYWTECLENAAYEAGFVLTKEQINVLSIAVEAGHDNYGQCFYRPPDSDRYHELERQHEKRIAVLEKEKENYISNAEKAIKQALGQRPDAQVSIGDHGEVTRYGGRIERIQ